MIIDKCPLFHRRRILLLAVLIVIGLQVLYAASDWTQLADQGLRGPDSYTRVLRVFDLYQGGGWYDTHFAWTNAPYGEILHWGRPLDAILLTGAWLASPFTADARSAVYISGFLLGPFLALLMVPILSWGTRPFLGSGTYLMVIILSGMTHLLASNISAGRPDHHGFLALLFMIQLAACFRLGTGSGEKGTALLLGAVGGLAIWASVMAMAFQLVFTVALAVHYVRGARPSPGHILWYAVGLVLMLTIALPLERPPSEWLTPEFKRLSIVHWTLAAATAATWTAICAFYRYMEPETTVRIKLIALLAGSAVPLAIMAVLFPKFFLGPQIDYDSEVMMPFVATIQEYRSLLPITIQDLEKFLIHLGGVSLAVGFTIFDYCKTAPRDRTYHYVLLIGFAVYGPLALWATRFAIYAQVLALVPWAMMSARIMLWSQTITVAHRQIPIRGFFVILTIIGPLALAALVQQLAHANEPPKKTCPIASVSKFLTNFAVQTTNRDANDRILITYLFWGPELAWRTPYKVVGAPYGNSAALKTTHAIFGSETNALAKEQLNARNIELVLYCSTASENRIYRRGTTGSLISRIENGVIPKWLSPVPLPADLSPQFKLFRIVRP